MPQKRQTCVRIARHIGGFATSFPITVDDEASGVELFEEDETGGHLAGWEGGSGQADGFGLVD